MVFAVKIVEVFEKRKKKKLFIPVVYGLGQAETQGQL